MSETKTSKKKYVPPAVTMIGSLAEETRTGGGSSWWKKRTGPGDQFIFTDPANCWDGHYYNNCQETSA